MPKFMFVYREAKEQPPTQPSPEQMQQSMQSWLDWIKGGMEAGWITNPGDALKPESRIVHSDASIIDGPFAESKELVGGYSVVEAKDIDHAAKLTEGCPIFAVGGKVEVRPLMNVEI